MNENELRDELSEAYGRIIALRTERDTLIRRRAADVEALNAVQALHAQAVAERDEARRQVEAMREVLKGLRSAIHQRPGPHYRDGIVATLGIDGLGALDDMDAVLRALAVPSTNGGG